MPIRTILPRRGTAAAWQSANPILSNGEMGYESDTTWTKRGDGVTHWNDLPYGTNLKNTATLDFGVITAQSYADLTITVTGAALGDSVSLGVPNGSIVAGVVFSSWVSAADTVTVRAHNYAGTSSSDIPSGTFKATVVR